MRATPVLAVSLAAALHAQSIVPAAPYRARVLGVLDSAGAPVENVWVTDVATGLSALTTRTGTVSLAFVPDGGDTVWIHKIGYRAQRLFVAISPSDTTPVMVFVAGVPTELPRVTAEADRPHYISPALRDFEERRSARIGQFISEAELRKSDGRAVPDLLRRFSGMSIHCSARTPVRCTAISLSAGCPPVTYLNGVRVRDLNLAELNVSEFGGVEAYMHSSQVPPLYNATDSTCGVLLFWFRER